MGMSHDFEIAIEEGATIVRVGTAIFGERNHISMTIIDSIWLLVWYLTVGAIAWRHFAGARPSVTELR